MTAILRKYALFFIIFLIGLLLLGNIYLIRRNNRIIQHNKALQEDAETIKVAVVDIIKNIHFMDMTLRGYALREDPDYTADMGRTILKRDQTWNQLESMLAKQQYPMKGFYLMKDSIDAYYEIVGRMKRYLDADRRDLFLSELAKDQGFKAWKAYDRFQQQVEKFENNVAQQAQIEYNITLRNSYLLQIVLFFIIVPTLGYTVFYTSRSMKLTEQLRLAEADRNQILEDQRIVLEERVKKRTLEIQAKNEEIINHNRQLTIHQERIALQHAMVVEKNKKLEDAKKIIEAQSEEINMKNHALTDEVAKQTQHLLHTNLELVEHNNRLEQFTYIISHNLRAPITRLVGLSNVLKFTEDEGGQKKIVGLIVKSTHELDEVIADLNQILRIQQLSTAVFKDIPLDELLGKVKSILDAELKETQSVVIADFGDLKNITSLPQYVESIFYNLISNAIKYRHPERPPIIRINTGLTDGKVKIEVSDNGLGIDVEKNRHNIFNLYKRFHFHVEGKGLGLYLVKTQVTALGGTIDIQSRPDEGTVFTILLNN